MIGNEWTFWQYAFFSFVVAFAALLDFVLDNWLVILTIATVSYVVFGGSKTMKFILLACLLAILLSVSGCAQMFACTTTASFKYSPDGTREVQYTSCKEQIGLDAEFGPDGTPKHVKVDKSGTQESVIAATSAVYLKLLDIIQQMQTPKPGVVPLKP